MNPNDPFNEDPGDMDPVSRMILWAMGIITVAIALLTYLQFHRL